MPIITQLGEALNPEFRPAANNTVSAIGAYLCVKRVAAEAPNGVELTAAQSDVPCGITVRGGIAAGAIGDMCIHGRTRVTAAGAIAAGARIAPDANGKVVAAGAADVVIGSLVEEAFADGDVVMAEINIRGANVVL